MNDTFKTPKTARNKGYKTTLLNNKFYVAEDNNNVFHLIYNGRPFKLNGQPVQMLTYKVVPFKGVGVIGLDGTPQFINF